jgi:hypothetical protein
VSHHLLYPISGINCLQSCLQRSCGLIATIFMRLNCQHLPTFDYGSSTASIEASHEEDFNHGLKEYKHQRVKSSSPPCRRGVLQLFITMHIEGHIVGRPCIHFHLRFVGRRVLGYLKLLPTTLIIVPASHKHSL